jgi:transposase-like protein
MAPAVIALPAPRTRRRHSRQFRAQVVSACLQPGVSLAAVSLANGLNTNMVRRWVKEHREGMGSVVAGPDQNGQSQVERTAAPTQFVAVAVAAESAAPAGDIRVEVRRRDTVVQIRWPAAQAQACAQWLGSWLR